MVDKIVCWIKSRVRKAGAEGIVLGLSGGIDSAVVAALCIRAIGRGKVLALFLPCKSNPDDLKDAKLVAKSLGLKTKLVKLSKVYNSFLSVLPGSNVLSKNNLKPRLRMTTLYYFANKLNYLVCGTGNKSELMVGYFTKYGDGGVDILPIGDLLKYQVRSLAKELKIPEKIILKAPTAGLWKGQTDEGEMGLKYKVLDEVLKNIKSNKIKAIDRKAVSRIKMMLEKSEHKRRCADICRI